MAVVKLEHITKHYEGGGTPAVDDVSLTICIADASCGCVYPFAHSSCSRDPGTTVSTTVKPLLGQKSGHAPGAATCSRQAAETRLTPIVLTALTTIGGLLPLTLRGGTMLAPMGWTIIGGLLVSTILTLLMVPVVYKLLERKRSARLAT